MPFRHLDNIWRLPLLATLKLIRLVSRDRKRGRRRKPRHKLERVRNLQSPRRIRRRIEFEASDWQLFVGCVSEFGDLANACR